MVFNFRTILNNAVDIINRYETFLNVTFPLPKLGELFGPKYFYLQHTSENT